MMDLNPAIRQARSAVLAAALESKTLTLYTTPKPAAGAAITTQVALAEFGLPATIIPVDAVITLSLSPYVVGMDGTAVWGRITDDEDAWVLDGDCGNMASSALFKLQTVTLTTGGSLIPMTVLFAEG